MRFVAERPMLPIALALAAAGAVATAPMPTLAQSVARAPLVQVNTGRGQLVTLPAPMSDLFVADDKVADVQVRSPTQLYVYGKAPGETTVSATSRSGKVVWAATVRVGNNFDSVGDMLRLAIPDSRITVTPMNGLVLLTGTIQNPDDGAEAERLAQAFVGESTRVLSRLKTATPLQVNLQVRFAEVSRSFFKQVGVNVLTRDTTGGFQFGVASGRAAGTIGNVNTSTLPQLDASALFGFPAGTIALPFDPKLGSFVYPDSGTAFTFGNLASQGVRTSLGLAGKLLGLDVLSAIDLGEQIGQVTTLANPNLTALSGETGTFLAGGEFPIPINQGLGAVSIEYKQYGIGLTYTPTVLADGRISLRVKPEVSQLSDAGAVQLNDITIPALTTRRAETTVELGSGQSFMIAGLLQNSHQNSIDKAPGLGDLPILGALFRSNGFRRNETELVIVITPYLVKPVDANRIALPTDGYKAPTDAERIIAGQLSSPTQGGARPKPTMAPPSVAQPMIGAATPAPEPGTAPVLLAAPKQRRGAPSAAPGFSNR